MKSIEGSKSFSLLPLVITLCLAVIPLGCTRKVVVKTPGAVPTVTPSDGPAPSVKIYGPMQTTACGSTDQIWFIAEFPGATSFPFASSHINSRTASGTATCSSSGVQTSFFDMALGQQQRNFYLTGCTGSGTVDVYIGAGAAVYNNASNSASSYSSTFSVDGTAPDAPTSFSMSPTIGTSSAQTTVTVSGSGAEVGASIKMYMDSSCATLKDSATVGSDGTFTGSGFSIAGESDGTKTIYYTMTDTCGNVGSCTASSATFTYQAQPIYSFGRSGYVVKEDGTLVGGSVTITRDVTGITDSVTIASRDVTALAGTHYTSSTASVNFAADDSSKTIDISSFYIGSNNATTEGDRYYQLYLSAITNGTSTAQKKFTQVLILDDEVYVDTEPNEFLLNASLYTVTDGDSSVTVYVQRPKTTAATTVDVVTSDATAVSGSDYTGTTQTISFGIGTDEVAVTIPLATGITSSTNKSFFVKLQNTSHGNTGMVRGQSAAKVRILTSTASSCDTTTSPFGGGTGTVGDPYLICTAAQLDAIDSVAAYMANFYKLAADIDLSTQTCALAAAQAGSTMCPLGKTSTTRFSGGFNGNEYAIRNFRYVLDAALFYNPHGLFVWVQGPSANGQTIEKINLVDYVLTGSYASSAGLIGTATTYTTGNIYPPIIRYNYASGYFTGGGNGFVGHIVGSFGATANASTTSSITFTHNFGAGHIECGNAGGSGLLGYLATNHTVAATVSIDNNINISNVYKTTNNANGTAGILGYFNSTFSTASTASFSNNESRGYFSSYTATAGILGYAIQTYNIAVTMTGNRNYGVISGTSTNGGIIGTFSKHNTETLSFSDNINYAKISGTGASVGGLIGSIQVNTGNHSTYPVTISNVHNKGSISSSSTYAGGIIGFFSDASAGGSALTATIQNNSNSGTVTATSTYCGGIIGNLSADGGALTNSIFTISNNSNTGTITGSAGSVGGILGAYDGHASSTGHTITLSSNTNSGAVSGASSVGGIAGSLPGTGAPAYSLSNLTNSGLITGSSTNASGIVGGILGNLVVASTITLNTLTNTGNVEKVTGATGSVKMGGVIGSLTVSGASTTYSNPFTALSNSGNVTGHSSGASTGGIIGYMLVDGSNSTLTISNANVLQLPSAITVTGGAATGGYFGQIGIGSAAVNSTITLSNQTLSSAITVTGGVPTGSHSGTGGMIGWLWNASTNSDLILEDLSATAGTVSADADAGGILGSYTSNSITTTGRTLTLQRLNSSSAVSVSGSAASTYVGGILGFVYPTGGGTTLLLDTLTSAATVSGVSYVGGVLGEYQSLGASNISTLSNFTRSGTNQVTASGSYLGGVIGSVHNGTSSNQTITLSNLSNSGSGTVSGASYLGGIIGRLYTGTATTISLNGATNSAPVSVTTSTYGGGIIGYISTASTPTFTLANLTNESTGTVTSVSTAVGGIIGGASFTSTVGITLDTASNAAAVTGTGNVGGIFGILANAGTASVTRARNTGTVTISATGNGAGGIVGSWSNNGGSTSSSLSESYSTGNLVSTNLAAGQMAGLIGSFTNASAALAISDCWASGTITSDGAYLGGLVGNVSAVVITTSSITYSYSRVEIVSTNTNKSGLVNRNAGAFGTITSSYWRRDGNGGADFNSGVTADAYVLTDAQLQNSSNFSGWTFYNTGGAKWYLPAAAEASAPNNTYPTLVNRQ